MELTIKWQSPDEVWHDYDQSDIAHMSRTHAKNLFSQRVPVIAKQDSTYIVNTVALRDKYKAAGKKVIMFLDIKESADTLGKVGLIETA